MPDDCKSVLKSWKAAESLQGDNTNKDGLREKQPELVLESGC